MRFCPLPASDRSSRPARGAWVEISKTPQLPLSHPGRAPQGARGLKSAPLGSVTRIISRAPQGARGLKFCSREGRLVTFSRAPQGARGLKSLQAAALLGVAESRPARGAWVEIRPTILATASSSSSRPARGAWVEIQNAERMSAERCTSRPARGAWVEMRPVVALAVRDLRRAPQGARGLKSRLARDGLYVLFVAPRKGCVG